MFGIGEEEINAVADTIRKGVLTRFQGGTEGYLAQAERDLAEKIGVKHALMVNSGTSALMCAMVALGIGKGDEVLVSAYTWISTPLAPMLLQAVPKLVEINETLTMDPDDLERKITPKTKAIVVIHMANRPCDMDRIMEIADRHHIPVVEDTCQAVGGLYKGRRLGSIGAIGCFSFNNYKNITCGEGGAILTNDPVLFDRARLWHDAGTFVQAYDCPVQIPYFAGQDYRASEIEGALIWAQLKRLDPGMAELRKRVAFAANILQERGFRVVPHNDPETSAALGIIFDSQEEFQKFAAAKGHKSIHEIAGRHIYTNWIPLVERNTYRDDVNPYLTPEGADVRYDETAAPRTLDILRRTLFIDIVWNEDFQSLAKRMRDL
ncbi:MAG: DegT/DnrJ/EryC1/StrS family aminotransferase [Lentisphaeria bacterium]|nr:DegT/DnrJ/EryC1/StrS family aminotransferase [Lentisphaeria bacterium]